MKEKNKENNQVNEMKKELLIRWSIYLLGMLILAVGLSLNTQVMLGVSPILSTAFTIYSLTNLNFGDATLIIYSIFVLVEVIIHMILRRYRTIPVDILQIPFSIIFTRFLNIFKAIIPDFSVDFAGSFLGSIGGRLIFLGIAIILTGIGATLSLNMRIIPNPGDGIVQAIADLIGKSVGFTKNCVDFCCVILSVGTGFFLAGKVYGIGIGTLLAMLFVGRVIALINHFFKVSMLKASGLEI